MVDLALPRQLHALGQRAVGEALGRRAGTVEAEHVLLAILAHSAAPAAALLASSGLDYAALETALDAERERSLGVAGIAPPSSASLAATPRIKNPGWGASIRDVLRGADKTSAKGGRPGALEIELAIAILRAELGTVPRALAIAAINRTAALTALAPPAPSG
jgi:ATP-dependent Clp protease ATP-binding subunit ClpA